METFEAIYKQHYLLLIRAARKMLGHDFDATDIIQEVFLSFHLHWKEGQKIRFPKSWLYRATLNKCIDLIRSNQKYVDYVPNYEIPDDTNVIEKRELQSLMNYCLSKLKLREKELLVLYSEGLSYKEMAEITEIPKASVGKTVARSLKKLEKELKLQGYEMPG